MPADLLCPQCGKQIPSPETACPHCAGGKGRPRLGRTPLTLALLLALIAALWALTGSFTRELSSRRQQLAQEWFARGQQDLSQDRAPQAADDIRTALVYSPDNAQFRLRLAEALARGNQVHQAQAYLLALWDEEPGNATVNLELARLAARSGQTQQAVRYFHGAIDGLWESNPSERRRETRLELIGFLLDHREQAQAESELLALAADLPADPHLLDQVGSLFAKAHADRRALDEYRRALRLESKDPVALAGAGRAAFALGLYNDAERYLKAAGEQNSLDAEASARLRTATLVLQLDPYRQHLSLDERVRRALTIFRQAKSRAEQCAQARGEDLKSRPPVTVLETAYARAHDLEPRVTSRFLRRDPDMIDAAVDTAFQLEQASAQQCGTPTGADLAIFLLAQKDAPVEQGGSTK